MSDDFQSKRWTQRFVTAARMFAVACFAVAGYLVLSDSPTGDNAPAESLSLNQAARSSESIAHATRPIETIRVGDRVLAANPEIRESEQANRTEPEWANCLHLRLEMPLEPEANSENPAILHIELLRPESWVRDRLALVTDAGQTDTPVSDTTRAAAPDGGDETASVGTTGEAIASVPLSPLRPIFRDIALASAALSAEGAELIGLTLEMDLPEMGASGTAVVTDLRSSPMVKRGDGQVVTATFAHPPSRQVLDVAFEGESEPIGVTDNHLFWSVDREQFQAIGDMEVGERVQTHHGDTKRIVSKLPRPGPQTVYNLEVYSEHVYFVGQQGLLAHNAYSASNSAAASARHTAWGQNLNAVNGTTSKLSQRALRESGGDWQRAEEIFEGYLQGVSNRLQRTGGKYAVEIQPAANADGRVWNFIQLWHGNRWSDKLYAFPGSRRLDAGIVDMTTQPNSFGLRPLSSGFDITLDARKPNIVQYYQEYFGNIPIFDLRPR